MCSVPDLIVVMDAENGGPITTEELRYGFRVDRDRRAVRAGLAHRGRARARRPAVLRLRHRLRPRRGKVPHVTYVELQNLDLARSRAARPRWSNRARHARIARAARPAPAAGNRRAARRAPRTRRRGPPPRARGRHAGRSRWALDAPHRLRRFRDGAIPARIARSSSSSLEGLERMGIGKIAIFSSHGGNFTFLRDLVADYEGRATLAGYSDLGRFLEVMMAAAANHGLDAPETDVHAGGLETSMMLAAYADHGPPLRRGGGLHGRGAGLVDADLRGRHSPGQRERRSRRRHGRESRRSAPPCSTPSRTSSRRTSAASSASDATRLGAGGQRGRPGSRPGTRRPAAPR